MKLRYLCFLVILISPFVHAYDFEDGIIDIPKGFEGPMSQNIGPGSSSTAYKFPHADGSAALLQITTWNPGTSFPQMSEQELKEGSKNYLLQFLGGIERKRENFERQEVEFIEISGRPAAKVEWNGTIQEKSIHGVMYCLVYNSKIYSFHTQDFSSFNGKYTKMAVNAFENIELKR